MGPTRTSAVAIATAAALALGLPPPALAGDAAPAKAPIALAAPKDFEAAVRAIEAATGAKGERLGDAPLKEARSFAVEMPIAERLLEGSHATFRRAGVYLFRWERSFGMGDDKDLIGLVKTADFRAVIRRVRTAGPNNKPSTEKIAAWLAVLAREQPFELREVGTDYVAGRFHRPPNDPVAMAKRCAEFAPELVAGRASTLDLLAKEIETRGTLYLIW